MVCRLARAPSTCTTLRCTSSRASASWPVMSANERVSPPSSSREANTGFALRSPWATWRTPSASSSKGRASWLPSSAASSTAPNTASTSAKRERADVHAAQAVARERALLVLAVGSLHRQRIGGQRRRQQLPHHQVALLLAEREVAARDERQRADAGIAGGCGTGVFVQAFELTDHAAQPRLAHHRGRRAVGHETDAAAGRHQGLAGGADDGDVLRRELFAQALQRQRLRGARGFAEFLRGQPGAPGQFVDQRVERAAAQIEAGIECGLHLHVEPALDAARHELVAHQVDQHTRHHAHQRKDRGQLEQQAAAELAAPNPQRKAHGRHADHQHQQGRDGDVDPEQPDVVPLVQRRAVGGHRQQEREHQARPCHRHQGDDPGPARGFGHGNGRRNGGLVEALGALHRERPVGLAADADLHRPWQQRGVEPEAELDIVAATPSSIWPGSAMRQLTPRRIAARASSRVA